MTLSIHPRVLGALGVHGQAIDLPSALTAAPFAHLLILGESETGKTALAMALAGLVSEPAGQGMVFLHDKDVSLMPPRERAAAIGFVPTNPIAMFSGLAGTVERELELSFDLLGLQAETFDDTKSDLIRQFQLDHLLARNPFDLSGGERVKLGLALAMVKRPKLLVLDQIFDALAPNTRRQIQEVLQVYLRQGGIVVETHSFAPDWCKDAHLCICLSKNGSPLVGRYRELSSHMTTTAPYLLDDTRWNSIKRRAKPASLRREHNSKLCPKLCVHNLSYTYPTSGFGIGPITLSVDAGEAVAITGPNGAGKTTLLMSLGLLRQPATGSISIVDWDGAVVTAPSRLEKMHIWARYALYAFQEPDDQIYCKNVQNEISETSVRVGRTEKNWIDYVVQTLCLKDVMHKSPMVLPRPVRRIVSIASVLAAKPPVMLLDEPTGEMDRRQKARLLELLMTYRSCGGICLFISHDTGFIEELATQILTIDNGALISREHRT